MQKMGLSGQCLLCGSLDTMMTGLWTRDDGRFVIIYEICGACIRRGPDPQMVATTCHNLIQKKFLEDMVITTPQQ